MRSKEGAVAWTDLWLPAYTAVNISTVAFLGIPTAESVRLCHGHLLVNLYITPKSIFMTLSPSIYLISMGCGGRARASKKGENVKKWRQYRQK